MKKERLFTNRQLLTLLWPLIIEQMLEILVGMADTVMVSSVGEAAISCSVRWPPAALSSQVSIWGPNAPRMPPKARASLWA